ncbi:Pex12 amino terminal region-domain-containing protein [Boletus reticuloceps]|uniref:RING-type E3 ubiquitin transferase (cysteine targeting) n=1 Tax=Boletus reticuloceps TaxID=495285 RepID=A0A8I3ADR7_9AGAM|nr:Pex12 amino terminal region-domain-containing protein [Boletus reticuloceps]
MSDSGSSSSTWQELWQQAYSSTTAPYPRIMRVGQLDAELLDQELVHLLYEPLQKSLNLISTALRTRFDLELRLVIRLALYKFSLWNLGASYGARLQGLKYSTPNMPSDPVYRTPGGLPRRTFIIHGVLTIVVPYLYNRLRAHALSQAWPDTPSSDTRRMAWRMLTRLESMHSVLSLLNFVAFLLNGRHRSLSDRFLGMSLVPTSSQAKREVSYEFMNRQMEFLLFLLPLINTRSLQRQVTRLISQLTSPAILSNTSKSAPRIYLRKRGKYEALSADQCAVCAENASYSLNLGYTSDALSVASATERAPEPTRDDEVPRFPIHTPYITSCGHVYCYHCIAERMMRTADEGLDSGWECLRCAESVKSADRLEAEESIPAHSDTMSDYEFSSDVDVTDLSGSASSYLGSLSE